MNFYQLKQTGFLTAEIQILLILVLCIVTVLQRYRRRGSLKAYEKEHAVNFADYFAPLYEEMLFRGLLFRGLLYYYSPFYALAISSVIFGLWHVKNIFILGPRKTAYQILYAGVIFSPIVTIICFVTGTLWIGVIIHYVNNLWVLYQWEFYKKLHLYSFVKRIRKYI